MLDLYKMKFLVNSMLGKLARFLRIFGYDTIYANDLIDLFKVNPVPDEMLIDYARKNDRFIITKDLPLYKSYKDKTIYPISLSGIIKIERVDLTEINFEANADYSRTRRRVVFAR